MKKFCLGLTALLLTAAVIGCAKAPKTTAPTSFKSGTWLGGEVVYVFYEDGESGRNADIHDGIGIGFAYELAEDGSCLFHMGGIEDNTPAAVTFSEDGNAATIIWETGGETALTFVGESTADAFVDSFIVGEE